MPPWMLPRPSWQWPDRTVAEFRALFDEARRAGTAAAPLEYRLAAPKAQFLCYLGDQGLALLHGSNRGDIRTLEPRQADDVVAFGAQRGVYASADGIWATFFAVIDRDRYDGMLVNSCVFYGEPRAAGYFFSLERRQLASSPWRGGWVYLLPTQTFGRETLDTSEAEPAASAQYCSLEPVTPFARLRVSPQDFPFLHQVVPHDHDTVLQRAAKDPAGFPWVDLPAESPH
jgi:hypothetical protein